MRIVARAIYGVFGGLAIGLSLLALFKPALALPIEDYSTLTAHLVREQAAEGMFIGMMSFWCLLNFDQRRPVHFALILFTAVFAGIHWAEYFHGNRQLVSPLLNSVPFLAFVATTPLAFLAKAGADPAVHSKVTR
jgi:hypothetical protein